jgi:MscS family membrane protein
MSLNDMVRDIGISVAILASFYVGGKAVIYLLNHIVKKITEKTSTTLDDKILAVVKKPAFGMILLWGAYISVSRLSTDFPGGGLLKIADDSVFIIAVALVVKVSYDVIGAVIEWYGQSASIQGHEAVAKSIIPLLKKLVKIFAVISGLIVVLDHFSYNITSLVTALGVSSLAVGLAAKETLSNMISGFTIALDKPFRIGDRIEVDGKTGDIVEIGLRSTKLRTLVNNVVIIPNSKLVDNVVMNYAYPENVLGNIYSIGVEYGSDVEKTKRVMLDVADSIPEILKDPPPMVFFTDHGDFALILKMVYRIPDYTLGWVVLDKVNTEINRRFAEEGIGIAFPTQTLYLRNEAGDAAAAGSGPLKNQEGLK